MQILRRAANALLWILAVAGAASGAVWGATEMGMIQPLVVISGSMEPEIMTGDLVVDVKTDAAGLKPGDVVSLPSPITQDLITHRIVSIEKVDDARKADDAASDASFRISLKGDANEFSDATDYLVGDSVWTPAVQLSGWGSFVLQISKPNVAIPIGVGLIALLGVTLLLPAPRRTPRAPTEGNESVNNETDAPREEPEQASAQLVR